MDKKANNTEPDNREQGFVPVQYKILKLSARTIIKSPTKEVKKTKGTGTIEYFQVPEYSLMDMLTMTQGNDSLISIGDSILLQKIREVRHPECGFEENGDVITPNEQQYRAYLKLKKMQEKIQMLKDKINKNPNHESIEDLNKAILEREDFLFVPDIINVESNKTSFRKFARKGFYYGKWKYVIRNATAGNLKDNTVTFIREDIEKEVVQKLRPGFRVNPEKEAVLPPTKFGAYEGLSSTGTIFVKTPRVVVIPDFEYITFKDKDKKRHRVYFVQKNADKTGCDIDIRPFFETKQEEELDEKGNPIYCAYLNSFDGMGLITPAFAEEWSKQLHIDYLPSAFNVRANGGVKGLLVTFPLAEYAKAKNINSIVDIKYRGMPEEKIKHYPLWRTRDDGTQEFLVDVILTESQWKYKKLYKGNDGIGYDFDCFNSHSEALWGVQRCAPKRDKDCTRHNYQLVSTSKITVKEDVEEVAKPTGDYLKLLAKGEIYPILYHLLKYSDVEEETEDIDITEEEEDVNIEEENIEANDDNEKESEETEEQYEPRKSVLNEALRRNHDLVKDSYVGNQIKKNIESYLTKGKAGKLYPQGNCNYQFMISDPYALCQWAFRWYDWMDEDGNIDDSHKQLTTTVSRRAEADGIGLVPPYHVYSNYWKRKEVSKIDACRSPMTDIAEHNLLDVCNENNIINAGINKGIFDEMQRYYRYIKSGIIYSIHDLSTVIHSDSDFDSDMVCTFNSDVYIRNAWNVPPTTYYKGVDNMQPAEYSASAAVDADLQGFGNKVGVYSNKSTSLFAMIPLFEIDKNKKDIKDIYKRCPYEKHNDKNYPECSVGQLELYKSIKKDRYLIGEEIDSTKTGIKPKLDEFDELQCKKWNEDKNEIKRKNQEEIEDFAHTFQAQNMYKPKYMPYFFINAKKSYKEKWTRYLSQMRSICKFYTYESIDTFVRGVLHGTRNLETDDEKYFWEYFKNHSPLLLTDCVMNKVCWELEKVEDELQESFKTWQTRQILWEYAKAVEVSPENEKFVKAEYEKYKTELMQIYSKKNKKESESKTELFKVGKRDALVFKIRQELLEELKVGWNEIFNILVAVLRKYPQSKHNSINGFIWNIMDEDILNVIPPHPMRIRWREACADETATEILGKKIVFWEEERKIEQQAEETDDKE